MLGQRYYTPEEGWIRKDIVNNRNEFYVRGGFLYNPGFNGPDNVFPLWYGFQEISIKVPDGTTMVRVISSVTKGESAHAEVFLSNQFLGSCSPWEDITSLDLANKYTCNFETETPATKSATFSIRATYGSNPWGVQFHAVDFLISKERFLLKDGDTYQTITDNALTSIGTEVPTAEIFTQSGFTDINQIVAVQSELGVTFDILRYDPTAVNTAIKINHLPSSQLIIPNEDIPISGMVIKQVQLAVAGSVGTIKAVASFDHGDTWKTYKNNAWSDCILTTDAASTNGMTATELAAIPAAKWAEVNSGSIRVAYLLSKAAVTDDMAANTLTITGDAVIWEGAGHKVDYNYKYVDRQTLQVKLLASGSYKINLVEVSGR